jgi:hypothetical protein
MGGSIEWMLHQFTVLGRNWSPLGFYHQMNERHIQWPSLSYIDKIWRVIYFSSFEITNKKVGFVFCPGSWNCNRITADKTIIIIIEIYIWVTHIYICVTDKIVREQYSKILQNTWPYNFLNKVIGLLLKCTFSPTSIYMYIRVPVYRVIDRSALYCVIVSDDFVSLLKIWRLSKSH